MPIDADACILQGFFFSFFLFFTPFFYVIPALPGTVLYSSQSYKIKFHSTYL